MAKGMFGGGRKPLRPLDPPPEKPAKMPFGGGRKPLMPLDPPASTKPPKKPPFGQQFKSGGRAGKKGC